MSACIHTGGVSRDEAGVARNVCPSCGAAELIHDTRDMPYVYKGEHTTVPEVMRH